MYANSSKVGSRQGQVHPRLDERVMRHLQTPYRKPVGAASARAFDGLAAELAGDRRPRILDAGCGTGASTLLLARRHPQALLLGVDKSAQRLAKGLRAVALPHAPENVRLLRCDLVDFWLLAAAAGWRFAQQYLLYPNPWPKPEHLMRRWPAHPVLPALLQSGGALELRCNWQPYALEWARALSLAGRPSPVECLRTGEAAALTPFEAKYRASGHTLWRVCTRDRAPGETLTENEDFRPSP